MLLQLPALFLHPSGAAVCAQHMEFYFFFDVPHGDAILGWAWCLAIQCLPYFLLGNFGLRLDPSSEPLAVQAAQGPGPRPKFP